MKRKEGKEGNGKLEEGKERGWRRPSGYAHFGKIS